MSYPYFLIIPGGRVIYAEPCTFETAYYHTNVNTGAAIVLSAKDNAAEILLTDNTTVTAHKQDLIKKSYYELVGRFYLYNGTEILPTSAGDPSIPSIHGYDEEFNTCIDIDFFNDEFVAKIKNLTLSDNIYFPHKITFVDDRVVDFKYEEGNLISASGEIHYVRPVDNDDDEEGVIIKDYLQNAQGRNTFIKHGEKIIVFLMRNVRIVGIINSEYVAFDVNDYKTEGVLVNIKISADNFPKINTFAAVIRNRIYCNKQISSVEVGNDVEQVSDSAFIIGGNLVNIAALGMTKLEDMYRRIDYLTNVDAEMNAKAAILDANILTYCVLRGYYIYHDSVSDEYFAIDYDELKQIIVPTFTRPTAVSNQVMYKAVYIYTVDGCYIINDKYAVLSEFAQCINKMFINDHILFDITIITIDGRKLNCSLADDYLIFEDGGAVKLIPDDGIYYGRYGRFNYVGNYSPEFKWKGDVVKFPMCSNSDKKIYECARTYILIGHKITFGTIVRTSGAIGAHTKAPV